MTVNITSVILNGARSSTHTSHGSCIHSWQVAQEQGETSQESGLSTALQRILPKKRPTEVTEQIPHKSVGQGLDSWKHGWQHSAEQPSSVRAGRLHPVGDRAHEQGEIREGSPLWQGEEHLTDLEGRDLLHLDFMSWCQGGSIPEHRSSGIGTCDTWSSMWDLQFASLTLGSPFATTKEQNVLFHKGFFAVLLKAFGTESIKHPS